jgi:hypothetical protein
VRVLDKGRVQQGVERPEVGGHQLQQRNFKSYCPFSNTWSLITVRDLRLSQQFVCGLLSSGVWRRVIWYKRKKCHRNLVSSASVLPPWRWQQHIPLRRWCVSTTSPSGLTPQMNILNSYHIVYILSQINSI